MKKRILILSILLTTWAATVWAGAPVPSNVQGFLETLRSEAKVEDPSFQGFDSERGRKLYLTERNHSKQNQLRSCTTCHTKEPGKAGQTEVGKPIEPLNPKVNPARFKNQEDLEKWFYRNCKWVFERECTSQEKGDFLSFMFSL